VRESVASDVYQWVLRWHDRERACTNTYSDFWCFVDVRRIVLLILDQVLIQQYKERQLTRSGNAENLGYCDMVRVVSVDVSHFNVVLTMFQKLDALLAFTVSRAEEEVKHALRRTITDNLIYLCSWSRQQYFVRRRCLLYSSCMPKNDLNP